MKMPNNASAVRVEKLGGFLLLTSVICISTSEINAGNVLWTNPASGFYESTSNWTPNLVPGPNDVAILGLPGNLTVGLLGDQTIGGLEFGNNSETNLRVAGANPTDKTLTILGDTSILNATVDLGRSSGSDADLHLDNQGRLRVNGSLAIRNSARVVSDAGEIGTEGNDIGHVSVSGSSPDGEVSFWRLTDATIGVAGEGTLSVDGGGFVLSGESQIATRTGSVGRVSVSGVDAAGNRSRWNTGLLSIGPRGNGTLNIEEGGIVSTLNGRVGSAGTGQVSVIGRGVDGSPSTWTVARLLTIGALGEGSVMVDNGGQITAQTVSFMSGEFTVSGTDAVGEPSLLTVSSSLAVGTQGLAKLDVTQGGRLFSESATIGFTDDGVGEMRVRNNHSDILSVWENADEVFVGGSRFGRSGNGKVEIGRNGLVTIGNRLTIWSTGNVTLDRGRLVANSIDVTDGGALELFEGELAVQDLFGDLTNQGAIVQVDNVSGNVINESGVLAPGPKAGATTIGGSFTQQTGGTLSLDIGGREPGTSHDLVGVAGTAVVAGRLEVQLIDGFLPNASDQFTMLGADSIVGQFENIPTGHRVATADGAGSFVVHYGIGSAMEENRLIAYAFLGSGELLGDFDKDGTRDVADIDLLSAAVGSDDLGFDLVYDATIDAADRVFWVEEIMNTFFGDANLDGEFNSGDFIHVFARNEYEDEIAGNSGWADGDWNGDGDFDSSDFLLAFQSGGYEMGPRLVSIVPEPASTFLVLMGFLLSGFSSANARRIPAP